MDEDLHLFPIFKACLFRIFSASLKDQEKLERVQMLNDNTHTNKYYTCKRMRLLEYLRDKGFEPEKSIPDPGNPKYNWWLFKNTKELSQEVQAYFNK